MKRKRNQLNNLHKRLRKTKAALLATALTLAGILLMMTNGWLAKLDLQDWEWLHAVPLGELGGTLFGAGLLGTLFEYSFRKDQEEATIEQFREIIKEQAPAMRDAVIEGFAIHPEDLKRVANPDLLDDIASNVMALRLGDERDLRRHPRPSHPRRRTLARRGGSHPTLQCTGEEYRRYSSVRRYC